MGETGFEEPQGADGEPVGDVASTGGIGRRRALQVGGITAAALGAPIVVDSFTRPAWAAGTQKLDQTTYNGTVIAVSIPAGRQVAYDMSGAGGGGGANTNNSVPGDNSRNYGGNGGAGTKLTGTIPSGSAYTLYVAVGEKGNRGVNEKNGPRETNKGNSLYGKGGEGADHQNRGGTNYPGRGGGGGGASAISNNSTFTGSILVVAPGGGGGGGRGTHWGGNTPPHGGALSSGSASGSVLNGANGTTGYASDVPYYRTRPGEKGYGGTSSVGTGGKSGGKLAGDNDADANSSPGFNGGAPSQNTAENTSSYSTYFTKNEDGGGGGKGGINDDGTTGWDGAGGGGGGGGYRGGGGGGGGKGNDYNGAGDGGGAGSGSAYATGAGTASASGGASGGAGGKGGTTGGGGSGKDGAEGTDGWVKLNLV